MKTLDESVAAAMDGRDASIVPFLPYILRDTWELGTSPEVVIGLIERHIIGSRGEACRSLRLLDLGCGKGAVSVKAAAKLGCSCLGIDALEPFVEEARRKAEGFGVAELCRFETGDIRLRVREFSGFDVVVLGAIGPVLGDWRETLEAVSPCLAPGGLVIVDDGYLPEGSAFADPRVTTKAVLLEMTGKAGFELVDEVVFGTKEMEETDAAVFEALKKRCLELAGLRPELKALFLDYIRAQEEENEVLETKIVCAVFALRRTGDKRT